MNQQTSTIAEIQKRAAHSEQLVESLQKQLDFLKASVGVNQGVNDNSAPVVSVVECDDSVIAPTVENADNSNSNSNSNSDHAEHNDGNPNTSKFEGMHSIQPDSTFPIWYTPYSASRNRKDDIMVYNSLVPSMKVPFVPNQGKLVKWYTCGPTVYAPSHMGHARTYITFDIIRNIMEYYFGYRVNLVMNITDVDDKIILRARQNYLFDVYVREAVAVDAAHNDNDNDNNNNNNNNSKTDADVIQDLNEAFAYVIEKRTNAVATAKQDLLDAKQSHKKDMEDHLMGAKVKLQNIEKDFKKYQKLLAKNNDNNLNNNSSKTTFVNEILKIGKSALSALLDKQKGAQVKDQKIFRAHAERYEKEYFEDMRTLNIRDPDVLTRVTEYIPEIIKFVERLIENGYAYESNSSVYFNVDRYRSTHEYPKLDPKKLDNTYLLNEAEGGLSIVSEIDRERKSPRDFAVWKASKTGEPQWQSPWGYGRPGWHIECSAMASQVLGDTMDIHTGGTDLKFPHHDNEMAQSCAFYSNINASVNANADGDGDEDAEEAEEAKANENENGTEEESSVSLTVDTDSFSGMNLNPGKNLNKHPDGHYYHQQWVNYWFHSGHLHINNLKMSKSLKNFISIRQALQQVSPRQIRILFLLQSWQGTMNYSDQSLVECKAKEHHFIEFFLLVSALNRSYGQSNVVASTAYAPTELDQNLNESIMQKQLEVDDALRDNFNYSTSVHLLFALMNDINKYLTIVNKSQMNHNNNNNNNNNSEAKENKEEDNNANEPNGTDIKVANILLINKAASFINDMLKTFGVISQTDAHFLGNNYLQRERFLWPVLDVITEYRNALAQLYRNKKEWSQYSIVVNGYQSMIDSLILAHKSNNNNNNNASDDPLLSLDLISKKQHLIGILIDFNAQVKEVLALPLPLTADGQCDDKPLKTRMVRLLDTLRDETLFVNDIKIEDVDGMQGSFWKLYANGSLMKLRIEQQNMDLKTKTENRINFLTKQLEQWSKKALSVLAYFQSFEDESGNKLYSQFDDENGIPTHDQNGKELSKKLRSKKLSKLAKKQLKVQKQYQTQLTKNPQFMQEMQSELHVAQQKLVELNKLFQMGNESDEEDED